MQVHLGIDSLPRFKNAVITIGTFDGVHLGHQKIIKALVEQAENVNGESVLITFDPHPRKIINPKESLQLINTPAEKIFLLQQQKVDHLVIVPFTIEFSEQSAEDYIRNFLIGHFRPHTIIIGYDHHFGKGRKGNYQLLEQKAAEYNYQLQEIPRHVIDEITISSTKIRKAIQKADIETANKLLGYEFFFEGIVIAGDKMGRQLGYPTANLHYTNTDKIHLGEGVFAVYVQFEGKEKKGMMSIGTRPTFNDVAERVEVNIFDFEGDLYGKILKVTAKKFLRPQEKYEGLEPLIKQIELDKIESLKAL